MGFTPLPPLPNELHETQSNNCYMQFRRSNSADNLLSQSIGPPYQEEEKKEDVDAHALGISGVSN